MVDDLPSGNLTLFITIDGDKLDDLKKMIREATNSFKSIKGGMFVLESTDNEGSL